MNPDGLHYPQFTELSESTVYKPQCNLNGTECCLILTLLIGSAVRVKGRISSQTGLEIHLALHFRGSKLLPFYECENCDLVWLSNLTMVAWLVSYRGHWKLGSCFPRHVPLFNTTSTPEGCGSPSLILFLFPLPHWMILPASGLLYRLYTDNFQTDWSKLVLSLELQTQTSSCLLPLGISEVFQILSWVSVPSLTPIMLYHSKLPFKSTMVRDTFLSGQA